MAKENLHPDEDFVANLRYVCNKTKCRCSIKRQQKSNSLKMCLYNRYRHM